MLRDHDSDARRNETNNFSTYIGNTVAPILWDGEGAFEPPPKKNCSWVYVYPVDPNSW